MRLGSINIRSASFRILTIQTANVKNNLKCGTLHPKKRFSVRACFCIKCMPAVFFRRVTPFAEKFKSLAWA